MFRPILTIFFSGLLILGSLAEINPAYARKGGDDSRGFSDDGRRGRGRGQDDVFEGHRREGRRGQHHQFEDDSHHRGRGRDDGRHFFPDDSGGRGRGRDDR